jgi:hypothetical protein
VGWRQEILPMPCPPGAPYAFADMDNSPCYSLLTGRIAWDQLSGDGAINGASETWTKLLMWKVKDGTGRLFSNTGESASTKGRVCGSGARAPSSRNLNSRKRPRSRRDYCLPSGRRPERRTAKGRPPAPPYPLAFQKSA